MPELPEVETTRRGLLAALEGQHIEAVEVLRRDLRWPVPDALEEALTGQCITALRRIGKYLIFDIKNGVSVLAHLGMSGTFRTLPEMPETLRKHDHLVLIMESGEAVIFHDPRRFGFILLCPTDELLQHPRLAEMGPDPFDKARFTAAYLQEKLVGRKGPIKAVLLDQSLIAGIGNIYASEALFEAGIAPKRAANSLNNNEIQSLIKSIREVLAAAIASGGSTLRDFLGSDGQSGYFQHAFKVYDRAGELCTHCSQPLQVEKMAGRSTYFCKNCQK